MPHLEDVDDIILKRDGEFERPSALGKKDLEKKLKEAKVKIGDGDYSESLNSAGVIAKKMRELEKAEKEAVKIRNLSDGRVRYYFEEVPSGKPGPTRGRSQVTEYNTKTGQVRHWSECYDHDGNVNRVHPKMVDGQDVKSTHYPLTAKEKEGK